MYRISLNPQQARELGHGYVIDAQVGADLVGLDIISPHIAIVYNDGIAIRHSIEAALRQKDGSLCLWISPLEPAPRADWGHEGF